jgi:hypothetical protein
MVHPALSRVLATAYIEDVHRAAERDRQLRLARHGVHKRRVAATPIAILRSAWTRLRGRRTQAEVKTRSEIPRATPWPCASVLGVRSGPRAGIDPASSRELPASSLKRTSCGSE